MWLVAHVIIKQITIRFGPSVRWSHESYKQMLYQYISIQTAPFYFQSTRICCPYPDRSQGFWIWMLGSSLDLIVEECDKCKYPANKKAGTNHAKDVCLVTWFLGKSNENKLMVMKKKKEEEDHYSLQFHSSCFSRENLHIFSSAMPIDQFLKEDPSKHGGASKSTSQWWLNPYHTWTKRLLGNEVPALVNRQLQLNQCQLL